MQLLQAEKVGIAELTVTLVDQTRLLRVLTGLLDFAAIARSHVRRV